MLTRYLGDLENMRVLDLIVYYLRNEKKDHTARRVGICERIQRMARLCGIS